MVSTAGRAAAVIRAANQCACAGSQARNAQERSRGTDRQPPWLEVACQTKITNCRSDQFVEAFVGVNVPLPPFCVPVLVTDTPKMRPSFQSMIGPPESPGQSSGELITLFAAVVKKATRLTRVPLLTMRRSQLFPPNP